MIRATSLVALGLTIGGVLVVAPAAHAADAGWVAASSSVKSAVVKAVNAHSVENGGPSRAANCYTVERLKSTASFARAFLVERALPASCQQSDGEGSVFVWKSSGTWTQVGALDSGGAPARCYMEVRIPSNLVKELKKYGGC